MILENRLPDSKPTYEELTDSVQRMNQDVRKDEQLRALFDCFDELIHVLDPESYKILYANKNMETAFGDCVGRTCYEVFQNQSVPCSGCALDEDMENAEKKPRTWELKNRRNGRWYRCVNRSAKWPDGRTVRCEFATDITSLMLKQKDLQASVELYETLLEIVDDMVFLTDSAGYVSMVNSNVEDHYDMHMRELRGSPLCFFWCGDSIQQVQDSVGQVISTRKPVALDCACGDQYYDVRINPLIENGAFNGMICLARDITHRKNMEKALRASQTLYTTLVEKVNDMVFLVDAGGSVQFANSFVEKHFCMPLSEFVNTPLCFFWCGDSIRQVQKILEKAAAQKDDMVLDCSCADMSYSLKITPLVDGGLVTGFVCVARDITRRKHMEEELKEHRDHLETLVDAQTAALKEVNDALQHDIELRKAAARELERAKKEAEFYLDLMSHDLTNFHQIGMGNLSLVEKSCDPDDRIKKYLSACRRQFVKSESLISKVRAFSQVKNIQPDTLPSMDVNRAIMDAIKNVSIIYPKKSITFDFKKQPGAVARGTDLIESVFANVLENAVKHNPSNDVSISVDVERVRDGNGSTLNIRIQDNGPGVPHELKESIFSRYMRIGEEKGMGLGLSLVRAIVEKYGGGIHVEDAATQGAVFVITLPCA